MPKMKYSSPWVNDDIKVTQKLNITLGLRFDWTSGVSEEFNRFSTFDPSAQNPVGHLGATVFNASQATGKSSWSVGPRFGFAYSVNPKTVVRGGYGIYYAGVQADSWDPYPVDGYQTNPVAPNLSNDQFPAFYFNGNNPTTSSGCAAEQSLGFLAVGRRARLFSRPLPRLDLTSRMAETRLAFIPRPTRSRGIRTGQSRFQRELSSNMAIDITRTWGTMVRDSLTAEARVACMTI